MHLLQHLFTTATETATQAANGTTQSGAMDMTGMLDGLLLVMSLIAGVYGLYSAIRLRLTWDLFPNKFLYPANCDPKDCNDPVGFIEYIFPRMMIFSLLLIAMAVGIALTSVVFMLDSIWINVANLIFPLGVFGWYMVVQKKVYNTFW